MSNTQKLPNRWLIAIMGTVLQLVLGTVYAWSYFQKPVMDQFGWSNVQVMWIFSIAILFLGISAAYGGLILPKFGPKKLASIGALLYGLSYLIAAFAMYQSSLVLFYIGFGIIGGIGLGLGYVTPVATASKWFPDKKGFITGMVVMGFGLGALLMSKIIAPMLIVATGNNLIEVFAYAGVMILLLGIPSGLVMKNPPANYVPKGYTPPVVSLAVSSSDDKITVKDCIFSGKFLSMWVIFFLNISAGIMFIGLQSPMLQDLLKLSDPTSQAMALASAGATLIAVSSLFNGVGRFFWGGLSDKFGRIQIFRLILGSQLIVFTILTQIKNPWIFGALVCYVLLCYGGGFGTMPSFVLDVFKARLMPVVYGSMLTAWAMAGVVGPQIAAYLKDTYKAQSATYTFYAASVLLFIGLIIAFTINNKPFS